MPNTTDRAFDRTGRGGLGRTWLMLCALAVTWATQADVRVNAGPTSIPDGEATGARDLTITNARLAFAIAVDTPVAYGVPRGAIVDIAPVIAGRPARDRIVFADFIPNNWSGWPNSYQKVEVIERGPEAVVVETRRDWGEVLIHTKYTLRDGSDRIELQTTMTNGGAAALPDLLSGQTLWPSAGFYFGLPGLGDLQEGSAAAAIADRAVAYDEDWAIALHAPYVNFVGSRSKDLFLRHTLPPGGSRTFDAWLQVLPRGDLAPVVASEIVRRKLPAGSVQGRVTSHRGDLVASPVVVASRLPAARNAQATATPYAWVVGDENGRYLLELPAGEYELTATAKGHSEGRIQRIAIVPGSTSTRDFADVEPPGRVTFDVADSRTAAALDARIAITQGQKPRVEYLGRSVWFTELDRPGHSEVALAPGRYELRVSSGGGFVSPSERVTLDVPSGEAVARKIRIARRFDPRTSGWYAADMHHHADQAEGVTPPADLARSQLAAGLDLLFVSDHDSTANHATLQQIANRRGVPLIPSVELSPSWGHFNAWPLLPGQRVAIDTGTATIDQVFAEARRQGAVVVQANHPLIPYGYFASLAAGVVPGGFNPAFDLAEINADVPFDDAVLQVMSAFWNEGHRYYLSAGTDVHDVWTHESGRLRLYAHLDGSPSPVAFAEAAKAGHAYASYGPLIFPLTAMFGDTLEVEPRSPFELAFRLQSVAGLRSARLMSRGKVVEARNFADAPNETTAKFALQADRPTWYSLDVTDVDGRRAFTNPVWVDVVSFPPGGWTPPAR